MVMKKVVLLGDSIRQIGYGTKVPELLGKEYTVWQPDDNCRFVQYTMRGVMHEWKSLIEGADVIHWNNGLWDVCDLAGDGSFTPKEIYGNFILRTLRVLKQVTPKIIFATTTPVALENQFNSNRTIEEYNAFIVPKLREQGVVINDLYTLVSADVDHYIRKDDHIHLTDAGIDVCADAVAAKIRSLVWRDCAQTAMADGKQTGDRSDR